MKVKNLLIILFLFILSSKVYSLEVTLTQGTIKPTPIAITDIHSANNYALKIGKNISMVISDNLERSGLFISIITTPPP